MATFTVTIDDSVVSRLVAALCATYEWDGHQDQTEFCVQTMELILGREVANHEARVAADAARVAAESQVTFTVTQEE